MYIHMYVCQPNDGTTWAYFVRCSKSAQIRPKLANTRPNPTRTRHAGPGWAKNEKKHGQTWAPRTLLRNCWTTPAFAGFARVTSEDVWRTHVPQFSGSLKIYGITGLYEITKTTAWTLPKITEQGVWAERRGRALSASPSRRRSWCTRKSSWPRSSGCRCPRWRSRRPHACHPTGRSSLTFRATRPHG